MFKRIALSWFWWPHLFLPFLVLFYTTYHKELFLSLWICTTEMNNWTVNQRVVSCLEDYIQDTHASLERVVKSSWFQPFLRWHNDSLEFCFHSQNTFLKNGLENGPSRMNFQVDQHAYGRPESQKWRSWAPQQQRSIFQPIVLVITEKLKATVWSLRK